MYSIPSSISRFCKHWESCCKRLSNNSRILISPCVRGSVKVNVAASEKIGDREFVPGVESHAGFVSEGMFEFSMGFHEFKSCAWYILEKSGIQLCIKFFIQVTLPDVLFLPVLVGVFGDVFSLVGKAVLEDDERLSLLSLEQG